MGWFINKFSLLFLLAVIYPVQSTDYECSLLKLKSWIEDSSNEMWLNIMREHSYELLCDEIDFIASEIAGCTENFIVIVGIFDREQATEIAVVLANFYEFIDMIKFYCNKLEKTDLCSINAYYGCSTISLGTVQQTIGGNVTDLAKLCTYYTAMVDMIESCVKKSTADCTDNTEADFFEDFGIFQTAEEYCLEGCDNIIPLLSGTWENCTYLIDYGLIDWQDYCIQLQKASDCLYNATTNCSKLITDKYETIAIDTLLVYNTYFGCNIMINEKKAEDVSLGLVTMPDCPRAAADCFFQLWDTVGVKPTLNEEFGGWDFFSVAKAHDKIIKDLVKGSYPATCTFFQEEIWNSLPSCFSELLADCQITFQADTSGALAVQVVDEINTYLGQACDEGCTNLQEIYLNVSLCVNTKANWDDLGLAAVTTDLIFGLISEGGGNTETCKSVRAYFECTVDPLSKCPILQENWVKMIAKYSSQTSSFYLCNIFVNLENGDFGVDEQNNDTMFFSYSKNKTMKISAECSYITLFIIVQVLILLSI